MFDVKSVGVQIPFIRVIPPEERDEKNIFGKSDPIDAQNLFPELTGRKRDNALASVRQKRQRIRNAELKTFTIQ